MRKVIVQAAFGSALFLSAVAAPNFAAAQEGPHDTIAGVWDNGLTVNLNFPAPETGAGPVMALERRGGGVGPRGDYDAPILLPWASEVVRQRVENDINDVFQAEPKETCHPMGVPHILQLNNVIHVLPGPDVTVIMYAWDMRARMIYMNQGHPEDLEPSYFGHSVGHWEGETLVVDTIGFNDLTPADVFSTPHTEQLHVVERYFLSDDRETLNVDFTVEDPGAFTTAWHSSADYVANGREYEEYVCQENNRFPDGSEVPIPVDNTPDF